jgi:hypothetical protein
VERRRGFMAKVDNLKKLLTGLMILSVIFMIAIPFYAIYDHNNFIEAAEKLCSPGMVEKIQKGNPNKALCTDGEKRWIKEF